MINMLENITFKTELSDIITIEEISILFDSIANKYSTELVSLGMYPELNKLRKDVLNSTIKQRNAELSKLLTEISQRKREAKINIWEVLGAMGINKKNLQSKKNIDKKELEQAIYEEEQIINAYENSIRSLELKEHKIMNGKYPRIQRYTPTTKINTLRKQLQHLYRTVMELSEIHDNCFAEYEERILKLIDKTVITKKLFPKREDKFVTTTYVIESPNNNEDIFVETVDIEYDDNDKNIIYSKDYYQYEPVEQDAEDELIYQLLSQGNYDAADGTINGLLIAIEEPEY